MSLLLRVILKFFPLELSLVAPGSVQSNSIEVMPGILWAYAPKQKSLKSRTKRRELQYILPLKSGITGCPTCGHPIMFPKLCGNCLRFVLAREWEYRQENYTQERLNRWKERWEEMKDDWTNLIAIEGPKEFKEPPLGVDPDTDL